MRALVLAAVVIGGFGWVGCEDKKGDRAEVGQAPAQQDPQQQPAVQKAEPPAEGGVVYEFGPGESKIEFRGAKVTGSHLGGFKEFKGEVRVNGETAETGAVNLTIQTESLYADNAKLTGHLKSADFFDVQKYPTATFKSTQVEPAEGGRYKVTGELALHGATRTVSFPATIAIAEGEVTGKAEFSINRKEFGIVYPGMPDDLIRDDVVVMLDIKGKKQG